MGWRQTHAALLCVVLLMNHASPVLAHLQGEGDSPSALQHKYGEAVRVFTARSEAFLAAHPGMVDDVAECAMRLSSGAALGNCGNQTLTHATTFATAMASLLHTALSTPQPHTVLRGGTRPVATGTGVGMGVRVGVGGDLGDVVRGRDWTLGAPLVVLGLASLIMSWVVGKLTTPRASVSAAERMHSRFGSFSGFWRSTASYPRELRERWVASLCLVGDDYDDRLVDVVFGPPRSPPTALDTSPAVADHDNKNNSPAVVVENTPLAPASDEDYSEKEDAISALTGMPSNAGDEGEKESEGGENADNDMGDQQEEGTEGQGDSAQEGKEGKEGEGEGETALLQVSEPQPPVVSLMEGKAFECWERLREKVLLARDLRGWRIFVKRCFKVLALGMFGWGIVLVVMGARSVVGQRMCVANELKSSEQDIDPDNDCTTNDKGLQLCMTTCLHQSSHRSSGHAPVGRGFFLCYSEKELDFARWLPLWTCTAQGDNHEVQALMQQFIPTILPTPLSSLTNASRLNTTQPLFALPSPSASPSPVPHAEEKTQGEEHKEEGGEQRVRRRAVMDPLPPHALPGANATQCRVQCFQGTFADCSTSPPTCQPCPKQDECGAGLFRVCEAQGANPSPCSHECPLVGLSCPPSTVLDCTHQGDSQCKPLQA